MTLLRRVTSSRISPVQDLIVFSGFLFATAKRAKFSFKEPGKALGNVLQPHKPSHALIEANVVLTFESLDEIF